MHHCITTKTAVMKTTINLLWIIVLAVGLTSCTTDHAPVTGFQGDDFTVTNTNIGIPDAEVMKFPSAAMDAEECACLNHHREGERFRSDVCGAFYFMWNDPMYADLWVDKQQDAEAMLSLLGSYDLPDPSAGLDAGYYDDQELRGKYLRALAEGSLSLTDSYRSAARVMEWGILEIQEALAVTDNEDVILAYRQVAEHSASSLRTIVDKLADTGILYEPQALSPEEYDKVISGDWVQP